MTSPIENPDRDPTASWLHSVPMNGCILLLGSESQRSFAASKASAFAHSSVRGIQVEAISTSEKDPRLLTLKKERYDSIYWDSTPLADSSLLPLEHVQRILLSFFQALKPLQGRLAITSPIEAWKPDAWGSLLRQCGFIELGSWISTADEQQLWIFRRV